MIINSLEDFKQAINHPYRMGEYFFTNSGELIEVPENNNEVLELIDEYGSLNYAVNYEDTDMYFENGKQIPTVY